MALQEPMSVEKGKDGGEDAEGVCERWDLKGAKERD